MKSSIRKIMLQPEHKEMNLQLDLTTSTEERRCSSQETDLKNAAEEFAQLHGVTSFKASFQRLTWHCKPED